MNDQDPAGRAAQLREAFDLDFAQPAAAPAQDGGRSLLALRVGGDPYLLPLEALCGVVRDRPLLRLPTAVPEFLGLVGVRTGLVPVYSLRLLLGYAAGEEQGWLALARDAQVAFLFDAYDGHLRATPSQLVPYRGAGATSALTPQAAVVDGAARPIVDLRAALRLIQQRGRDTASRE